MEAFVLNDKFEILAEVDSYTSLIWCRRAHDIGAVDLEIEANTENIGLFQIGYFIYRKDTNDICRIDAIEVETNPEEGDKLIIGATDLKSLANQVSVIGEYKTEITQSGESNIVVKNDVKVEEWIREAMKVFTPYDSTILPKSIYKQFVIDNFSLSDLKGYEDMCILAEDKDLKLSEHINHLCKMSGMRWDITYDYDSKKLKLNLVKGLDKTVNQKENTRVLFSQTFDNLQSTKLSQAIGKMANVAAVYHNNASIVGDNGVIFSYLTKEEPYGLYRFELPVDGTKVEIPHIQTTADFIQVEAGTGDYKLNDDGTFTKGKGDYNYVPQYTIDEIKSYAEILRGLGLTKLRENRVTQKFESEINFNQFVYREDYDVGDTVTVQNDYGIQLDAKITEIVETWDETGYSIEPIFEFIGKGGNFGGFAGFGNFENTENDWDLTDCLITEKGEPMMTETDDFYLIYEDAYSVSMLSTEAGIALTNEEGTILTPTSTFRMTRNSGSEPVTTALYDVSTTPIEIDTVKISDLPEANSIGDACCLPIVQDGETKKIYFDKIKENIGIDEEAVQNIVNNSIAEVVANAPEDLNTLKEISDWISEHEDDASAMNTAIRENKTNIANKADKNHEHTSLKRTRIEAGTDLNTLTTPGEYYAIDNTEYGNSPTINFTMQVITLMAGFKFQILYSYETGKIFTRCSQYESASSHKWTSWSEMATQATVENKTNYSNTAMTELDLYGTVDVKTFWQRLYERVGSNGVVSFKWDTGRQASLTDGSDTITISGGTLIYSCSYCGTWGYFQGILLQTYNNTNYTIKGNITDTSEHYNIEQITTQSELGHFSNLLNEADAKHTAKESQLQNDINWVNTRVDGLWSGESDAVKKSSTNTMNSGSSIDFNTNKATIQIPIFSADATDQPTATGAMWIQEVKESEETS